MKGAKHVHKHCKCITVNALLVIHIYMCNGANKNNSSIVIKIAQTNSVLVLQTPIISHSSGCKLRSANHDLFL